MSVAVAPKVNTPAPARPASRLASVSKGRLASAFRYVFYGPEGVGKSTLAAHAPAPLWLDIEDGSGRLDVNRYPFHDGTDAHVPRSYADVLVALDDLLANNEAYQTLVIDTADRLESLIWRHICERDKKSGIEDYGYGKGYQVALDEWRALCLRFDRLRTAKQMNIVILAHATIRLYKNPTGEDFDRYQLRIHDKAAGFIKEWADVAGFVAFEETTHKEKGANRAKGYSTGRRLLHVARTAAYDAKTRIALPEEIELDPTNPWAPLAAAVDESNDPKALTALIEAELAKSTDAALVAKVRGLAETAAKANDAASLSLYLNRIRELNTTKEVQS